MINVKLIVLIIFVAAEVIRAQYCEICTDHILCKYPVPGPSSSCDGYDRSALLTKDDVNHLVDRINEKRNYVASGLSKNLPRAANMRKIVWSHKLAMFAQRWADQCDPYTRPDRQDPCRNLDDEVVGQNIASVFGQAPGLTVKSFVDTWFIQILEYNGSVTYYNKSTDAKTNHFTQLIWAETKTVGCGKAKFFLRNVKSIVERLVCNFSPKGNIHAKPVYAIGFAATQCSQNYVPDEKYNGLCTKITFPGHETKFTTGIPALTSLLRILNLSNNSSKQEIDPIKNNLKQIRLNGNETNEQRNQKIRHIVINNNYSDFQHLHPSIYPEPHWHNNLNSSRNHVHQHQHERGHSRVYHSHEHRDSFTPATSSAYDFKAYAFSTDSRRYEHSTEPTTLFQGQDLRKHYLYQDCTRKQPVPMPIPMLAPMPAHIPLPMPAPVAAPISLPIEHAICNLPVPAPCITDKCTRRQHNDCPPTPPCPPPVSPIPLAIPMKHEYPHDLCPCNVHTKYPPTPTGCSCNVKYQCGGPDFMPRGCCPKIARNQDQNQEVPQTQDNARKSSDLHYFDLLPNVAVRSGDIESKGLLTRDSTPSNKKLKAMKNTSGKTEDIGKPRKQIKHQESMRQVTDMSDYLKYIDPETDYLYSSFDSGDRIRRESDDEITFKPFWQVEEYIKPLPYLRYTTLANIRNRKSQRTSNIVTEPITINFNEDYNNQEDHITEKYLSFDELMHLRKVNADGRRNYKKGAIRQGKTTAKPKSTTKRKATTKDKMTSKGKATTKGQETNKAKTTTKDKPTTKGKVTMKEQTTSKSKSAINNTAAEKTTSKVQTTASTTQTSEYTINTPFERKKHCTRRLTCTWSIATITGKDGSPINSNAIDQGSRTPPGYVEGCTRTSTCTRDYMDRNRMATITEDKGKVVTEDEDYCEKRALNVERRDIRDEKENDDINTANLKSETNHVVTVAKERELSSFQLQEIISDKVTEEDCTCDEKKRKKRHNDQNYIELHGCRQYPSHTGSKMSYSDLYYLVIRKIMKSWSDKKLFHQTECSCNNSNVFLNNVVLNLVSLLCTVLNWSYL